ncbi:MAG TPA: expansin EXLX1 family cellulose-binding protein [Candidatus Binatia bacterium]|nr:expansin EXLX1 family cellulose-binding protein [Candidatus Binatia bacterium]
MKRSNHRRAPWGCGIVLGVALAGCGGGGGSSAGGTAAPSAVPPLGAGQHGDGTFYAATGAGSCSYDASPDDLMVAAINRPQYAGSHSCGLCADVTGPRGTVRVRIVDVCPECATGDLDLSREAFAAIADPAAGRVPIEWTPAACDVTGPIALRFKEGSSQWWLAVQVRNSRLPILRIELQTPAGFVELSQQDYNYALEDGDPGAGPYTFRITALGGEQIEETGMPLRPGEEVAGTQQFH